MQLNSQWLDAFNQLDSKDDAFMLEAFSLLSKLDENILNGPFHARSVVARLISRLDRLLSTQLDSILHHPDFQRLERNWLGLKGLASLPVNYQKTNLKLIDMSWHEISDDLNQAYNIRSSSLYNKIGNKELNTLGGTPFGCIAFTHSISLEMEFDASFDDLFTLELIGKLGEATLCPMVISPGRNFFVNNEADWLSDIERIEKILSSADYEAWQDVRSKSYARFLGIVLPNIRMRSCYKNAKVGFIYNESGAGLYGKAVFPFLSTVMREHHRVNWFGFLKSRWNGKRQGAVINLLSKNLSCEYLESPLTDVNLFGQLSTFYSQQGFIPLTKSPLTEKYFFNGNNSIWLNNGSDNDKVLGQLQTTMMCCRVAHYLKCQVREMIGSFNSAAECESFLTRWVEKFSSNVSFATEETLSRYPLSFAKVTVTESVTQPGSFACTLRIAPQYQYDYFNGEVVLTTELNEAE
ncbi:type VI secretion system contractile sheath large subunit [Vibrio sp. S4M6]|uniref:type VI secretion system contractile sheath domain-containing protein n=1 Tax=Vibrio sinus TaxID=2946865 RepID=UPI002029F188|nr:type VI secretion system contractile sheath large subunit [Vibrio sinus]MCL9783152.1 type VI secretion system contractile sheath large subunit [Vibrio sinus]